MGLKDRINDKSKALVQRKTVTLPMCGETVTVRGLMTGEGLRVNAAGAEIQGIAIICLCVEDPERQGVPLWNYNDLNDREFVGALHPNDSSAIVDGYNEISGIGKTDAEVLGNSQRTENSSSSSPSATESSPES